MNPFRFLTAYDEPRYRSERLRQIVAALPPSIVINPLAVLVLFLPFVFWGGTFGRIPPGHLIVALTLHVAASGAALVVFLRHRRGIADPVQAERQLVALQLVLSAVWGVMAWLYWDQGNGVNNIYVTMIVVGVVWAVMYTRVPHTLILLSGCLPLSLEFMLRIATAPGDVASLLACFLPLWTIYVVVMAWRGHARVDEQLAIRFANEDLSAALRLSTEEALRKRYEAEAANSAKTIFLANMSHELRTPLNAILGFADIIAQQAMGPGAAERYAEYAGDIHASGAHLLSLINDLLDVAKIEAGRMQIEPQPVDAARLIEEIRRLMAPRVLARGQSLHARVAGGLPLVMADERALRQIVLNLVSNAVKFTPQGGTITIRCGRPGSEGLLFEVEDDGPGIAPDKLGGIFEPFTQIDNRYGHASGGTGLGLALSRGLAELHGGRIWIDSTLGEGTKVSVYFPLTAGSMHLPVAANG